MQDASVWFSVLSPKWYFMKPHIEFFLQKMSQKHQRLILFLHKTAIQEPLENNLHVAALRFNSWNDSSKVNFDFQTVFEARC